MADTETRDRDQADKNTEEECSNYFIRTRGFRAGVWPQLFEHRLVILLYCDS